MHVCARKIVTLALVGMALGGVVRAETIEEIEKKLSDAHAKLKSYSAKTKTTQDFEVAPGQRMQTNFEGTMEWMRKGDKFLYRSETKGTTAIPGQPNKMESSTLMISDGDFTYTLTDQGGQKSAVKSKADPHVSGDPKSLFSAMREDHNLKVLPDAKVDGADCYVVEVVPKEMEGKAKTVLYFRKTDGISIKMEGFDPDGKVVFTTSLSDIKVNTEIPTDRFVFKAPAGVEIMDMSNQPSGD